MRQSPLIVCLLAAPALMPARANGQVVNGSFESSTGGLPDNWNPTGNMQVISTQGETDGVGALAFSFGNAPSTGVIFQTFSTSAGVQYNLNFDFGKWM